MFKVPQEVGPFLVKQRAALKIAEGLLRGMGFEHAGACNYDLHGIIFSKIIGTNKEKYWHQHSPILQGIADKENYEEVRDLELSGNFEASQQSKNQRATEEMQDPEISSSERLSKRARIEHSEQ